MPWSSWPTKDVVDCDKPRVAVNKRLIRGFPNGETHPTCGVPAVEFIDSVEGTD